MTLTLNRIKRFEINFQVQTSYNVGEEWNNSSYSDLNFDYFMNRSEFVDIENYYFQIIPFINENEIIAQYLINQKYNLFYIGLEPDAVEEIRSVLSNQTLYCITLEICGRVVPLSFDKYYVGVCQYPGCIFDLE